MIQKFLIGRPLGGVSPPRRFDIRRTSPEPLAPSLLEALDDLSKLRGVCTLVIVSQAFLRVAAGARDREVLEIVGASVAPRYDVLQRCAVDRRSVHVKGQLLQTVNTLAL